MHTDFTIGLIEIHLNYNMSESNVATLSHKIVK
jgi:hypothetical protein